MSASRERKSGGRSVRLLLAALSIAGVVALVAGVPGPRTRRIVRSRVADEVLPRVAASTYLTTNNVRLGGLFTATIHAPPLALGAVLVSADDGPSTIFGQPVELGPNWAILHPLTPVGADWRVDFSLNVPNEPVLEGLVLRLQAAVLDPASFDLAFSNSVVHRVTSGGSTGLRVGLIRQTVITPDAPFAPTAASSLAAGLSILGCSVQVFDDSLPDDTVLAGLDCLLDCRFNIPPAEAEKDRMIRFLQGYGGVFLLGGPSSTPWGQQRRDWIADFLVVRLGIATSLVARTGTSTIGAEQVSTSAPSAYSVFPYTVTGMPYGVDQEGATFGTTNSFWLGSPWIVSSSGISEIYGAFFEPEHVTRVPVRGRVAVLFNGSAETFTSVPENPNPAMIMFNACWYLDS